MSRPHAGTPRPRDSDEVPKNLFFALRPDAAAAERIRALALRVRKLEGLEGRVFELEQLHVTLRYLGSWEELPADALAVADEVARSLRAEPFGLSFDRVMSFERTRGQPPLVLCGDEECDALLKVRGRLSVELDKTHRFKPDHGGFKAHVTMLYDWKRVSPLAVAPIAWTVSEMLLIRSHQGLTRHEVVARYPFAG